MVDGKKTLLPIRVCKNTRLAFEGNVATLNQLDRTGFYPKVVYCRTLKLRLNLYVARDNSFDEHGLRDLKTTVGFRHIRLTNETKKQVELLGLMLCITCGLLMLHMKNRETAGHSFAARIQRLCH